MYFLVIFGPPAVGKMAVGREIQAATDIRLFHNHMTIEPVLNFFEFGSPSFARLVDGFRRKLFKEAAASSLPGLSFTFVWDLESSADRNFIADACDLFETSGADIVLVELLADLPTRLTRNRSEERLREKPSKRNVAQSEANLLQLEKNHRMNSLGTPPGSLVSGEAALAYRHLVVDTVDLTPRAVAERIIDELGLPGKQE